MTYEDLQLYLSTLKLDLSPSNKQLIDKIEFKEKVPLGGHVAVPSNRNLLGPWHHGIRTDENTIVHMIGESKTDARVRTCTLSQFTVGTDVIALVVYESDSPSRQRNTVAAALRMLQSYGESAEPMYNILGFNCEHLAVLCRHGLSRSYSEQVQKVVMQLAPLASMALDAAGRSASASVALLVKSLSSS